jgi:microcystin-dependent protein
MMKRKHIAAGMAAAVMLVPSLTAPAAATPTMGDVIVVGFTFCPRGYLKADGQLLAISTHQALFSLLGTTYGGDGRTTFALPDLRGRVPVSAGQAPGLPDYQLGARFGAETTTMLITNMPNHTHAAFGTTAQPNEETPTGNSLGSFDPSGANIYTSSTPNEPMAPGVISHTGGSQPIQISAPTTTLRYCIATEGLFPSRG